MKYLLPSINQYDLKSGEFTHFKKDPSTPNSLSSNFITSILKDCCNELWIGTFDAGLNRYEIDKDQFSCYQHDPTIINSLGSNEVLSLFEDRSGILWIGTNFGYGINKFNRRKNKFTHYFHDPSNANSLSENVVFSIINFLQDFSLKHPIWVIVFRCNVMRTQLSPIWMTIGSGGYTTSIIAGVSIEVERTFSSILI